MKKVLLSVCVLVVATATFAQSNLVNMPNDNLTKGYSTISTTPNFTPSASQLLRQQFGQMIVLLLLLGFLQIQAH